MSEGPPSAYEHLIREAYRHFNARDIDGVLAALAPGVAWANGMDGGHVNGHDAVREYWTRQWEVISPAVEPLGMDARDDGSIAVQVHQVVRSLTGDILSDRMVRHVYRFDADLVSRMDIEDAG